MKKRRINSADFLPPGLPSDTVVPEVSVLLCGDKEVIIEGKCTLLCYDENCISFEINRKGKCLYVQGEGLRLHVLGTEACGVKGRITEVRFGKGAL